jgi:hypothetical protein
MDAVFVLVHSPSVGPSTWTPVAHELRARGRTAVVPSLTGLSGGEGAPYWPRITETVTAAMDGVAGPLALVPHSNAGLFVPVLAAALGERVAGCMFVDAALPPSAGVVRAAEPEFLPFLRGLADPGGRLPRWTDWWGADAVAALLPDERVREVVVAEQPRLALDYYLDEIPVPAGWDRVPCAYLWFGGRYADVARDAGGRGWPVGHVPGEHLHQVVSPGAVADWLIATSLR